MQRRLCVLGLWVGLGWAVPGCMTDHRAVLPNQSAPSPNELDVAPKPRVSRAQRTGETKQVQFQSPGGNLPSVPDPNRPLPGRQIQILAWVNGSPIFNQDVVPYMGQAVMMEEPHRTKHFNRLLKKIIDDEIVYQDAVAKLEKANPVALKKLKEAALKVYNRQLRLMQEKNKLTYEQLKVELRKSGMDLTRHRLKTERDFIVQQYLRSRVMPPVDSRVGHREIRAYYENNPEKFKSPDWVKWQDIFVAVGPKHPTMADARKYAEQLRAALVNGGDFVTLVKYDEGDSIYRDGEGFGHTRGQIRPRELEPYLFNMRAGEIGPLVEISTGVHLFRLVERKYEGRIPFTPKVQREIRSELRSRMAQREAQRIIGDLKDRAVIELVEQQ